MGIKFSGRTTMRGEGWQFNPYKLLEEVREADIKFSGWATTLRGGRGRKNYDPKQTLREWVKTTHHTEKNLCQIFTKS